MYLKKFLIIAGAVLIIASILGIDELGLGRNIERGIFGTYWYVENVQNWLHFILGVVSLAVGLTSYNLGHKILTWFFGLFGIFLSVYSLFNDKILNIYLEKPGDTLFYLVIGSMGIVILAAQVFFEKQRELEKLQQSLDALKKLV